MPFSSLIEERQEHREILTRILDRIGDLPSLSSIVGEFIELSRREFFTAMDFERVLSKDPALVARLLKMANSSYYGQVRTIDTIPEAVVIIGLDNMKKMVYAVSSQGLLRRELRNYDYEGDGFWRHAMGVAVISRGIAEHATDCDLCAEEAFVAGLLHDVGKLILDDHLDATGGRRAVLCEEELTSCGIDHTELAACITQSWNIPDEITEAVRYHHHPDAGGNWHAGAAVVALADALCRDWAMDSGESDARTTGIDPDRHGARLAGLGIPTRILPGVGRELSRALSGLDDLIVDD